MPARKRPALSPDEVRHLVLSGALLAAVEAGVFEERPPRIEERYAELDEKCGYSPGTWRAVVRGLVGDE